ncbi:MAG TPA: hypothetical protein VNA65_03355, partial [Candidatus Dormibacteraeota bacterium]|nr:hypothetical protein [Candidatus Dormibacteraeota bacterium]
PDALPSSPPNGLAIDRMFRTRAGRAARWVGSGSRLLLSAMAPCANRPRSTKLLPMGKGRDKQGREKKKPKKAKQPGADRAQSVEFRHHSVVMNQPDTPTRSPE